MHTEVHIQGAFEPILIQDPMEATLTNIQAAYGAQMIFFRALDTENNQVSIEIHKITHMREIKN